MKSFFKNVLILLIFCLYSIHATDTTNQTYVGLNLEESKDLEKEKLSNMKELCMGILFTLIIIFIVIFCFYMSFYRYEYIRGNYVLLSKSIGWFVIGILHSIFLFYIFGRFSNDQNLTNLILKYVGIESASAFILLFLYLGDEVLKFGSNPEKYLRDWLKKYKEQKFLEDDK